MREEKTLKALYQGKLTQEIRAGIKNHLKSFAVLSLEQQESQGKGFIAKVGMSELAHVPSRG